MILLVYPPAAKPCEPSPGLARLAGALEAHDCAVRVWDANLEGLQALLDTAPAADDHWTRQAWARCPSDRRLLHTAAGYENFHAYSAAVHRLNRVLTAHGRLDEATLSLADFQHQLWSPLRSEDLLAAAVAPERIPFYRFFQNRLRALLEESPPRLIGISLAYLSQALPAFALIGLIRRDHPGLPIIMGGGLLTSWMRRPEWKNPFAGLIDHLVAGPGEIPLLKCAGVDTPRPGAFLSYAGLELPAYFAPGPILPYDASRGCYWNRCAYCPEPAEGHPYQPLPVPQVGDDLQRLTAAHQPALIHFTDNAMSPALLQHLIAAPPGVPWYGFIRITRQLLEPEFCLGLKRSGCAMLKIGVESGDDGVLEGMQKGVTAAAAGQVLENLAAAGISTYIYLLFGTPWEEEQAARRTIDFAVRHARAITWINPAIFNLPRESRASAGLELRSFYAGDLALYADFHHPLGWERKQVRHFLDRTFKRQPAIAAILRRTPPTFTSNHAAFFGSRFLTPGSA
ncbi:MAG TPA: radical SAM protein [bacterium]|nr:radical SAM protein [bacterium]HPR88837.1 radical SAM protein [bacterium]